MPSAETEEGLRRGAGAGIRLPNGSSTPGTHCSQPKSTNISIVYQNNKQEAAQGSYTAQADPMAAGPGALSERRKSAPRGFFQFIGVEQRGDGDTREFLQPACTQLTGSRSLGQSHSTHLSPAHNQNPSCLQHQEGKRLRYRAAPRRGGQVRHHRSSQGTDPRKNQEATNTRNASQKPRVELTEKKKKV